MPSITKMLTTLGFLALTAGLGACANPVDEIDEEFDCNNLCNRYRDCYDANYDTGACRNRCQGVVDGSDPNRADACDACLDPRSCLEAAFSCSTECRDILP
jgi:hypothetical protein